jgi:aminomethyltransferase
MAQRTPLYAVQQAAGGKIIDFAGWDMPVQFAGIVAEHHIVRRTAGLFDLGHMGRLRVTGPDALAFLERRVCRRLADMTAGQVRYGLVLAEDGTVEDDVLVSREGDHQFHVVVNASNLKKIIDLWRPAATGGVRLDDLSASQSMIAVQGPAALGILAGMGLDGRALPIYGFRDTVWQGGEIRLSRTGYTGEDGCELFAPAERIEALWLACRQAGAVPCGLGARDTLRLEAAMPLYGHELDRSTTPVEAGLTFAINKAGGFIGAETVLRQLASGAPRRLVGLAMREKRVPRQGYPVLLRGAPVGAITSGTLSPTLDRAIGLAYVPAAAAAPHTALQVDVRGQMVDAEVVALPFYKRAGGR